MNRLKTIKTEEILTGGKTRQKRNGPGGSGCFHAFCYFLARRRRALRGGGLCAAATGRRGLGARFPANPCSFVNGHHVFGTKGAAGEPDVVLHSPQTLALSSTGTTSLGPKAPPASRTWCFTPRKPLLFRRRAPRLWGQRRCRRAERGASIPAIPCSFVDGHHVFGAKGAAGEPDVVLHSPQTLALSSTGTTSLGPKAPPASVPISISHRRKELTTEPRGRAFRRQFLPLSTGIAGIRDSQESCCSPGRFHPIKTPSRKRRVLIFSCYSLPRPLPRPATRRSTSVSFISSDTIMPSISSSFSTSSSGKRFRIRWQTMFM